MRPQDVNGIVFKDIAGSSFLIKVCGPDLQFTVSQVELVKLHGFVRPANITASADPTLGRLECPSVAHQLGQMVEASEDRKGAYEAVCGEWHKLVSGRWVQFENDTDNGVSISRECLVRLGRRGSCSFSMPDHTMTSASLPPGICTKNVWKLCDTRELKTVESSAIDIGGSLTLKPTNVGIALSADSQQETSRKLEASGGTVALDHLDCRACVSIKQTAQPIVPGKACIRSIVVGLHVKATIQVATGAIVSTHGTAKHVHANVAVDPAAAALGVPAGKVGGGGFGIATTKTGSIGLLATNVDIEGLTKNFGPIEGKPLNEVVDFLRSRAEQEADEPRNWQILYIEVDLNPMEHERETFLFPGNPGMGKSTILNQYAGKRLFRSG